MEIVDLARFFEDNIICNHVVTGQLFRYLSKSDLLECSLISTKWISPCRQFLRSHRECLLRLDTRKLEHFPATLLESVLITSKFLDDCDELFYNGIYWDISIIFKHMRLIPNGKEDIQSTFKVVDSILKKLPKIQFLTLNTRDWENISYHPFALRRLCLINLTDIEKLKIIGEINPGIYDAFFGQDVFPSLKKASIPKFSYYRGDRRFHKILQQVLSSSPVLKGWSSNISPSDVNYFAQAKKLHTIKKITIQNGIDLETVDQIEAGNVTLRRLVCHLGPTTENLEIFRRITTSSTDSLQKIRLDYEFCMMLVTTPGIRPLINAKKLFFTRDYLIDPGLFEFMQVLMEGDRNAQRIFPNARVVRRNEPFH